MDYEYYKNNEFYELIIELDSRSRESIKLTDLTADIMADTIKNIVNSFNNETIYQFENCIFNTKKIITIQLFKLDKEKGEYKEHHFYKLHEENKKGDE